VSFALAVIFTLTSAVGLAELMQFWLGRVGFMADSLLADSLLAIFSPVGFFVYNF
jgi:hypothetical protein